jgi:hypothetical protein
VISTRLRHLQSGSPRMDWARNINDIKGSNHPAGIIVFAFNLHASQTFQRFCQSKQ